MPDLTNPVKKDEWARSQGYSGWSEYISRGGSEQQAQGSGEFSGDVAKYVAELTAEAQGNFDFITKFLQRQHGMALGKNDEATAKFLEQVSNAVEERVGRIPFDFQQRTEREKQDLNNFLKEQAIAGERLGLSKEQLIERGKNFFQQMDFAREQETEQRQQEFNDRGLLDSGIQKKRAMEDEQRRQLGQIDPFQIQQNYQLGSLGLDQRALNLATALGKQASGRNLADIATTARRDAQDLQYNLDQKRESAQRDLASRLAGIKREGSAEQRRVDTLENLLDQENILNA